MGYLDDLGDMASGAINSVSETVEDVEEGASETYHEVKEEAEDTYDAVAEETGLPDHEQVEDTFSHYAEAAEDGAVDLAKDAYHAEQEYADNEVKALKWVGKEINQGVDGMEASAHESSKALE